MEEESGFSPARRTLAACLSGESTGYGALRAPGPASEAGSPLQFALPLLSLDGSNSLEAKCVIRLVLCWHS